MKLKNQSPNKSKSTRDAGRKTMAEDVSRPANLKLETSRSKKARPGQHRDLFELNIAQLGVWEWDLLKNTSSWNNQFYHNLGYTPGEVTPSFDNWLARVHPDDHKRVLADTDKKIASGQDLEVEYRVYWPDGTIRIMREKAVVELRQQEKAARYFGVTMDITDMRRAAMYEKALGAINQMIHAAPDMDQIMKVVMEESVPAFNVDSAALILRSDHEWVVHSTLGLAPELTGSRYQLDQLTYSMRAIESGTPQASHDLFADKKINVREAQKWNIRSMLVVPLVVQKEALGVVMFASTHRVVRFAQSDLEFAARLASAVSLALENNQLLASLQRELTEREQAEKAQQEINRRLALMADMASGLLQSNHPREVIERICQKALTALRCELFFHYVLEEKTRRLQLVASAGVSKREADKMEWVSVGEGSEGYVAQESTPMIVTRVPSSSDVRIRLLKSQGVRAYASYPLMNPSGLLLGTLSFASKKRESFDADDLALMQSLANHVAAALDRMKSREAMRRSEARYHALFRNMSEGFALFDVMYDGQGQPADFRFVDVNHSFEKISALSRDQFLGRSVLDFLPPEEKIMLARYTAVVTTGEPVRFEYTHVPTNRVFDVYAYRPADHQIAVVIMDVTQIRLGAQREQAALALAAAAQTAKDALQSMGEGVLLLDMKGKINSVNRAFEKMIGRDGPALEGLFLEDLLQQVTPVHATGLVQEIDRAIRGEAVALNGFELMSASGQLTPVFPAVSFIHNADNQPTAMIFSLRDISDIKKAEQERAKYEDKLKKLARELAATEDRARHRIAGQIHDTVIQTLSLSNIKLGLIRNKLDESGHHPVSTDVGTVRSLLAEAINESRALMAELTPPLLHELGLVPALNDLSERLGKIHGVKIEVKDDDQAKEIEKSLERTLFRAVRELIINALKHARANAIVVDVWRSNGDLKVRVSDDGVGFHVPRGQQFVHNKHGGFGLFQISERVEEIGGTFTITSRPGEGTTAELVLSMNAKME